MVTHDLEGHEFEKTYNNDKSLSEIQREHEKENEFVVVVVKVVHECDDFGVDVLRFHTCLTDILSFLKKLEWWFEQDIDDEEEEDEEGEGGSEVVLTMHNRIILSHRKSLWVRWIYTYKLRGCSFWEVLIRADSSWGWCKLLQLHDTIRPFFVSTLGDGMNTSMLFDNWCLHSPLSLRITPRDVSNAGFNLACRVADFMVNGVWNWPQTWTLKVPDIAFIIAPNLDHNKRDLIQWMSKNGRLSMFSVSKAWEDLRPRGFKVRWTRVVWYSHCISSHAFHLWLTLRWSLKTQDKLRQGDVGTADLRTLRCPMCNMLRDSHSHLFFECSLSSQVWCLVRSLAELDCVPPLMHLIVIHLILIYSQRTTRSIIGRLVVAATTYLIWIERNNRLFKNSRRSPKDIRDMIVVTVRLKLLSFRFKNTAKVKAFLMKWNMPCGFQIYVHLRRVSCVRSSSPLRLMWTSPRVPAYLDNWNTAPLQALDLMVHDLDRFFNGVECVVDLDFIQRTFKLMVITKALTLGGLVRSFLLRASAAMFAFTSHVVDSQDIYRDSAKIESIKD
nr:hypothetical protein [Tanacetum cinerariifolium]